MRFALYAAALLCAAFAALVLLWAPTALQETLGAVIVLVAVVLWCTASVLSALAGLRRELRTLARRHQPRNHVAQDTIPEEKCN